MCSHGLQQNSPRKPEAPGKGCLSSLPVCRLGNSYLLDETLEIPRTPLHLRFLLGLCSHLQWVPPLIIIFLSVVMSFSFCILFTSLLFLVSLVMGLGMIPTVFVACSPFHGILPGLSQSMAVFSSTSWACTLRGSSSVGDQELVTGVFTI